VVQIVNAVSMPEFSAAKRPEVVFCGVVGRRKGVHVLLRAWKDLGQLTEGWTLRLLGPGDVNALGVEPLPSNISVEGAVSRSAALTAQAQASIAVLPSFLEALPMFLIEAMSRGCAVISTDVGQILELVGESGLIVPAGDSDKLASALRRLMSDESTRLALGQAARERVKDNYSSDKVQRTLEKEWWKMARKYDDTSIGRDGDE
jgi:glycosyltransferase involved in cell wall biosynthesis